MASTETFAILLESSFEFFAWYNKTYQQQPSNHPEHPWCKLGQVLDDLRERGIAEPGVTLEQATEAIRKLGEAAAKVPFPDA